MAAMRGCDIEAVVQILKERGAYLYHACQLQDFRSYLQLDGVPSREVLEESGLPYTKFDTDESDQEGDIWDKVFLNLQDFGVSYARFGGEEGTLSTPNPYGPILLVFEPEVLLAADDLSITLRSAGAFGFDRNRECLSRPSQVPLLFRYVDPEDAPSDLARTNVAFARELRERFGRSNAKSVEINCQVPEGLFGFRRIKEICVDEYNWGDSSLRDVVNESISDAGRYFRVHERGYVDNARVQQINELADILVRKDVTLEELAKMPGLPAALTSWVARLRQGNVDFNFDRFAGYLRHGTLLAV